MNKLQSKICEGALYNYHDFSRDIVLNCNFTHYDSMKITGAWKYIRMLFEK